jgi:allophanate hydrolase
MTDAEPASLDIARLRAGFRARALSASALIEAILDRIAAAGDDRVWISRVPTELLRARAVALDAITAGLSGDDILARWPLFGIPFAVKDNIDIAGLPTTAACPAFSYEPEISAPCVTVLEAAGAIVIGKTNLDQFATGLVGCRSPYGVPRNPFDARFIPGGSSSGSAVAVAAGLVSFALGTDTAGSGRVPAAFNNIVGLKPTRGCISIRGVVPACRSLDCVSIFALSSADAASVLEICGAFDHEDPFSRRLTGATAAKAVPPRFRFAVPRAADLEFFGDPETPALFARAIATLEALGGTRIETDLTPFRAAGELLYSGPWVAERLAAIETFFRRQPDALLRVTRQIIASGDRYSASDAFTASYRLAALSRKAATLWDRADVLLLPTAGTTYTIAAVEADPLWLNSQLGYYTNFVNFLDLAAIAVPAGFRGDGLPFGVSLVGPAFSDGFLSALGATWQRKLDLPLGATAHRLAPAPAMADAAAIPATFVEVAVVGGHLAGMPLNPELVEKGAQLVRRAETAPIYRMFRLDGDPPRPGLIRVTDGHRIEIEIWRLDVAAFGAFVANVPAPLTIGTIVLDDGRCVKGFLCEVEATRNAEDISTFGGWRRFVADRSG